MNTEIIMKLDDAITAKKQNGSVLIISLVILIAMTLIGVTAMRTSVLEEKMSSNIRSKELAFQAAEAALLDGEELMESLVTNSSFDGTGGRLAASDDDPDFFADATWSTTSSIAYSGTLDNVENQPRLIMKYIGQIETDSGSLKTGGYGLRRASTVSNFRITTRGTGASADTTKVILQSYFGKVM